MKDAHFTEQEHAYPQTFPLADFRPESYKRSGNKGTRRQLFVWLQNEMPAGNNKEIGAHVKARSTLQYI